MLRITFYDEIVNLQKTKQNTSVRFRDQNILRK